MHRTITVGAAAAVTTLIAIGIAGAANAYDNNSAGIGFVGKAEVQTATGTAG